VGVGGVSGVMDTCFLALLASVVSQHSFFGGVPSDKPSFFFSPTTFGPGLFPFAYGQLDTKNKRYFFFPFLFFQYEFGEVSVWTVRPFLHQKPGPPWGRVWSDGCPDFPRVLRGHDPIHEVASCMRDSAVQGFPRSLFFSGGYAVVSPLLIPPQGGLFHLFFRDPAFHAGSRFFGSQFSIFPRKEDF